MRSVACVVFSDPPTTSEGKLSPELCELFFRLSPVIAIRQSKPYALFIHFRGLNTEDPDFEKVTRLKIQALLNRRDSRCTHRIGFASNAGFALLHAIYPGKLQTPLSSEILEQLLNPFSVGSSVQKKSVSPAQNWIKLLGRLGIRTLQDFTLLPPAALASRFGKQGLEFSRKLREMTSSDDAEAWPLFTPPERLIESREFHPDQPLPALMEPILFVAKELLDRLSARLRARLLRASQMRLELIQEGVSCIEGGQPERPRFELMISFCSPQGSAAGMLPSFRERLTHWLQKTETEETQSYGRELLSITLEVTETAPGHRAQRDFFHQHDEQAELWDSLLSRLSEKIGTQSSFQARLIHRYLPEKTWTRDSPQFDDIKPDPQLEIFPSRPTRLLREVVSLEHHDGWLRWPDTHEHSGKKKCVLKWIGPERICEGWWETPLPDLPGRDYFRVICAGGTQLWGFFELDRDQPCLFYLQGYYD